MILQLAYTHALVGATMLKFVHCVLNSCMSHSKDTVVKRIFALPLVIQHGVRSGLHRIVRGARK